MAISLGTLDVEHEELVRSHLTAKQDAADRLEATATGQELGIADPSRKPLSEWVRRADVIELVRERLPAGGAADEAIDDAIYAPYLTRLQNELAVQMKERALAIPASFQFHDVPGLSNEMRERLTAAGPADLDQASRVPGVTPAALTALHFALARAAA
jgi:tRNA uridine 5-carboxymethylaminomethyl modification enzyme